VQQQSDCFFGSTCSRSDLFCRQTLDLRQEDCLSIVLRQLIQPFD